MLILCGTKKLRDIFWSHVVHYNLSLFYLLLTFIFLPLVFSHERKKHLTGLIGFELCLILGSANNIAVMMFFSLSLFCALALESFLMGGIRNFSKKNVLLLLGETLFGCAVGFVLGKILTMNGSTGYSELFSAFSPADKWAANMEPFLKYWVGMFAILPEQNVPFFSAVGIKLLIRIGAALAVMAVTIRSFFSFRSISSRAERVFICVHWMICVEILFFFVFGVISKNNWRIIPMFFTALVTACIFLKNDAERYAECLPGIQLLDIGTAVLMLLHAGICGLSVLNQSIDTSFWFGQGTVLKTLADHSLTYGYNLDYWFSNSITVLTDEEIRVREVYLRDGKLIPSELQVNTRWYKDQPDTDRYFLICQEEEFWNHPEFADGAVDIYRVNQERTFRSGPVGFFIFVYEKNIF